MDTRTARTTDILRDTICVLIGGLLQEPVLSPGSTTSHVHAPNVSGVLASSSRLLSANGLERFVTKALMLGCAYMKPGKILCGFTLDEERIACMSTLRIDVVCWRS